MGRAAAAPSVQDVINGFREVAEQDPLAAWTFYRAISEDVSGWRFPRLAVGEVPNPDFDPDDPELPPTWTVLLDPYTGDPTTVTVIDVAERWTHEQHDDPESDRDTTTVSFDYGDGHFNELVLLSDDSGLPVRLPEGWVES